MITLSFRWAQNPKSPILQECFVGKFRFGAAWFDKDKESWCSYFDGSRATERTHETEDEAKASVETQASEYIDYQPPN